MTRTVPILASDNVRCTYISGPVFSHRSGFVETIWDNTFVTILTSTDIKDYRHVSPYSVADFEFETVTIQMFS